MYQLIDPILGLLVFISMIALTVVIMVLAQHLPDMPTKLTKWIYYKLNDVKQSIIFWNGCYWASFLSITLIWPEIGITISLILSIIFILECINDNNIEYSECTWYLSTLAFWLGGIISIIGLFLIWLYKNTIIKFNDFLNGK